MRCKGCGKNILSDSKFCMVCGVAQDEGEKAPDAQRSAAPNWATKKLTGRQLLRIGCIMFLGVFVLIPILITIFTPGGTSPSPESSPLATANEATGQLAEKWPNQELSDNYVREAIKETIENEWIKNVEIIDVYDYKIDPKNKFRYANLIITINPGEKWDGRQYLKDMAQYYVKCAQILFQHRRIYNFTLVGLSVFTDEYGKDGIDTAVRITWDRTISKKVDYDNFMDMAATDYTRVFSIAKEHYVCYAILKGLDDSEGELLR